MQKYSDNAMIFFSNNIGGYYIKSPFLIYILFHFRGHNYPIWCMDVSKNGLFIVTGSHDKTAKLWSLDRTFTVRVFVGHTSDVTVSFDYYKHTTKSKLPKV